MELSNINVHDVSNKHHQCEILYQTAQGQGLGRKLHKSNILSFLLHDGRVYMKIPNQSHGIIVLIIAEQENTKSSESAWSIIEKWRRMMRYQETRIGTGRSLPNSGERHCVKRRHLESFVFLSERERICGDVRTICGERERESIYE